MKILYLNPPFTGFGGMTGQGGKQAPLNIAYIAAEVRKQFGDRVEQIIIDAENLHLDFDAVQSRVREFNPDLVAMTFPTPGYVSVRKCARKVKEIGDIPIVVGGPHPSAFATELLEDLEDVDISAFGEGERTFADIVRLHLEGGSMASVDGIAWRDGSKIVRNANRELIDDLDELDFPARDLLPNIKYATTPTKRVSNRVLANMITSRGCPYDCTYCESKVIWTRKVRLRSVENTVDEIELLQNQYGVGEINFHDDILPIRKDRTIELCQEIRRRKLDVHWMCNARVNFIWEDVLTEMKKAGCKRVMFGLETGNDQILKNINKKATLDQAYEAVKICRKVGVETMGSFMIGNIGETPETIRETINFAKKLDLDTVSFFVTMPYPGTDLYRQAVQEGLLTNDINWEDYCVVGTTSGPMQLPGLSNDELRYWQSRALQEYYLRPKYVMRKLMKLKSVSELGTLLYGTQLLMRMMFFGQKAKQRHFNKKAAQAC